MPLESMIPLMGKAPVITPPQEVYGQLLSLQKMKAANEQQQQLAPLVYREAQAQVSQAEMKQKAMEQEQQDQGYWKDAAKTAKGDLDLTEKLATQAGASPASRMKFQTQRAATVAARSKAWTAEDSVKRAKNDQLLGHYDNFLKKPEDEQVAQWDNFASNNNKAGLIEDADYAEMQKLHPIGKPPTAEERADYRALLMSHSQIEKEADTAAKAKLAAQNSQSLVAERNAMTTERTAIAGQRTQATADAQRVSTINALASAPDPARFMQIAQDSKLKGFEHVEDYFDQNGVPIPGKMKELKRTALTAAQERVGDTADAAAARTTANQAISQGNAKERLRLAQEKADRETATEHKSNVLTLANQAIAESTANGGTQGGADPIDSAIKNVSNTGFYQNHPIGENRGDVLKALNDLKSTKIRQQTGQAGLDKKDELTGIDLLRFKAAHPGEQIPTRTQYNQQVSQQGKSKPGLPNNPPSAGQPAQGTGQQPPASQPKPVAAQPQVMRNKAGHVIEYDPQQNAWVDKATRKPV